MAEYALAHDPAWDTVSASVNGDGTSTYWANSFLPLWGRLCNVARYLVSSGTIPTSGASLNSQTNPDGTSLIGFITYTSGALTISTGTLRAALESIITTLAGNVAKAGDTITGPIIFSGTTARARKRAVDELPTSSTAFGPTADTFVIPPGLGASTTYTVNTAASPAILDGDEITIISRGANANGDAVIIAQEGGSVLATFTAGDDYGWVTIGFDSVTAPGTPTAYVKSFGSDAGTITLTNPYPLP